MPLEGNVVALQAGACGKRLTEEPLGLSANRLLRTLRFLQSAVAILERVVSTLDTDRRIVEVLVCRLLRTTAYSLKIVLKGVLIPIPRSA